MTIEQTLKDDERLSRKEAYALIQKALRLEKSTVEKKTIYEPDIVQAKANDKFFRRADLIAAIIQPPQPRPLPSRRNTAQV